LESFSEISAEVMGELVVDLHADLGAGLRAGVRTMSRESPPGVLFMSSAWRVLRGVLGVEGFERFDMVRLEFSFVSCRSESSN